MLAVQPTNNTIIATKSKEEVAHSESLLFRMTSSKVEEDERTTASASADVRREFKVIWSNGGEDHYTCRAFFSLAVLLHLHF